jgi:hypothetical protein
VYTFSGIFFIVINLQTRESSLLLAVGALLKLGMVDGDLYTGPADLISRSGQTFFLNIQKTFARI